MAASADDRHSQARSAAPPARGTRPTVAAVRRSGNLLYASGQTATGNDGGLIATGRLGEHLDVDAGRDCAWRCAANVVEATLGHLGSLSAVTRTVFVTVLVASTAGFTEHHLVADAASEYLLSVLGTDRGAHGRAAIGVASLPTGSPVEVTAVFEVEHLADQ